ncbi:hypothetical protein KCP74_17380 [Salmonella enterica subsp. enterica]|nr:hypothetical protein KCP74_17380 [Salmonella enterica subsp. enterica]
MDEASIGGFHRWHCSIGFPEDEMAIDNDSASDRLCWIIRRMRERDERLLGDNKYQNAI